MNQSVFLAFLLAAALVLTALDHAFMVFQIRSQIGMAPMAAMYIGTLIDWFAQILITVAIVVTVGKRRDN